MTIENLNAGISLQKEIDQLEKMIGHCKNKRCEWIDFAFGNGTYNSIVCNDDDIINEIKALLITLNTAKLEVLQNRFDNLK